MKHLEILTAEQIVAHTAARLDETIDAMLKSGKTDAETLIMVLKANGSDIDMATMIVRLTARLREIRLFSAN